MLTIIFKLIQDEKHQNYSGITWFRNNGIS